MKENKAGATVVSNYLYRVNSIAQRTELSQTGSAFAAARSISWGYDALGQVVSADSSIPGLDRAYLFDTIGNRIKSADSLTLPTSPNYITNSLNQYTSVNSVTPSYDGDGNMTSGPLASQPTANSTLIWDGENRLIQATLPDTSVVNFQYDAQSRRIAKSNATSTTLYVYDAWNPIAEYAISGGGAASISRTYLWGNDLSGTLQGAGGVGGLLAVTLNNQPSTPSYFPTYDGNGNVSEYLDATGNVVAHYEFDPFGRTTVATGAKAADFPHRFSTKPLESQTGLYYYGYRYYDPATGRWPSRDPIQERGGLNLYGFVGNNGLARWDFLGLCRKAGALLTQSVDNRISTMGSDKADLAGAAVGCARTIGNAGRIGSCFPSIDKLWQFELVLKYKCCICSNGELTEGPEKTLDDHGDTYLFPENAREASYNSLIDLRKVAKDECEEEG